ncbi:MAG: nucleotide sugar dehydrogenase [Candidatus Aminicenantales bacterium]
MNVLYLGAGFVGACSAAVSADSGHTTLAYDIDRQKISKLGSGDRDLIESCLYEEGLGDLLVRNRDRIEFTADYRKAEAFLDRCDAVFMCLPTPEINDTGESNLSFYLEAAENIAASLRRRNKGAQSQYIVIVNKSTVPIDTIHKTKDILDAAGIRNVGVVSNPEFLVEGQAVMGALRPDRIVIGAERKKDFAVLRRIYQRFLNSPSVRYIEVNPQEAAAGKLLANFTLFSRLAICFDVIGRTCESFPGIQFENVRQILSSDPRIGPWGLYDSLYAGGSCFIKDARSLRFQLQGREKNASLVHEIYGANRRQLQSFLGRAEAEAGFDWTNKRVALLGVAFKRNTNDIRNSPSLEIVPFLVGKKVREIRIYDPAAVEDFRRVFPPSPRIKYVGAESEAIAGADTVIIATEWSRFRGLDELLKKLKKRPLIMDGRRMLQSAYGPLRKAGFKIIAVGSPTV